MIKRILIWSVLAILAFFVVSAALNWDTIQRVFLGGKHTYETVAPKLPDDLTKPAILVFSKTNAFRHEEAIPAGEDLFSEMATANGWGIFITENSAVFNKVDLARFDAVIFNNTSGDVFSADQQAAFKQYILGGGGFVGIHAAGDSSHTKFPWYMDNILGALFIGHPMGPQFQEASVMVENRTHPATAHLDAKWVRTDEWYSYEESPRKPGIDILATLDESTYKQEGPFGEDLAMGKDHPIIWSRCAGKGRVFYSAMGHQASAFAEPQHRAMLLGATQWVMGLKGDGCKANVSDQL